MPDEHLNAGELLRLVDAIKTRIKFIIQDSEILLNNGGQLQIVAALYIHAIEEFGKLVYVRNIPDEMGITTVNTSNAIFKNHQAKIKLAQTVLPPECFTLNQGGFTPSGFTRSGFNVQEIANWETRLTIFNTDLKDGRVQAIPNVSEADIRRAIQTFKSIMNF